jgi:hypothetical protein
MNLTKLATLLAPAALLLGFSTSGFAGMSANGSFSFSAVNADPTFAGTNISTATVFQFSLDSVAITTRTGDFSDPAITPFTGTCGNPPDCVPHLSILDIGGNPGSIPDAFDLLGLVVNFDSAGTPDRFSYTITAFSRSSSGLDDVTFLTNGIFADSGGLYDPAFSSMRIQINKTGDSVSLAGTFATPASFDITPEPATMLLFGSALVGLGLLKRKSLGGR